MVLLTEWFFVEPKMVILWHRCEEPFKHLIFKSVVFPVKHFFLKMLYIPPNFRFSLFVSSFSPVSTGIAFLFGTDCHRRH